MKATEWATPLLVHTGQHYDHKMSDAILQDLKVPLPVFHLGIGIDPGSYALVTLHRPSNVDSVDTLEPIVKEWIRVSERVPVLFVAHPRTINALEKFDLKNSFESCANVHLLEPTPYIRFMSLVTAAKLVITDSGGLQEETTYLAIPCLTMRDNTERPITVTIGTNKLVDTASLAENLHTVLDGKWVTGERPPLWDGRTAERAVEALKQRSGN